MHFAVCQALRPDRQRQTIPSSYSPTWSYSMKRTQGNACRYICGCTVHPVNTLYRWRTVSARATLHAYKHGSPICRSVSVTRGTPAELCERQTGCWILVGTLKCDQRLLRAVTAFSEIRRNRTYGREIVTSPAHPRRLYPI